jgi:predicted glycosyltransferase involved in capsule biosynthesis
MNNLTFVTPLQIESKDRLRNAITIFSYLSKNFKKSKIIVKEIDTESKFSSFVLPEVEKLVGRNHNINHIFEKSDKLFNKSKVINDMVLISETDIVFNYDVDVMMPLNTYHRAYNMLVNDDFDVVYPYGCGVYQYNVLNFNSEEFSKSKFDLETLIPYSQRLPSVQGWCQMFKKKIYCETYGFNENFIFVGYEDTEFLYRMTVFGKKIGRVNNDIYHLDHVRVHNKNYSDKEFYEKNIMLWEWIRRQDKEFIENYYNNQKYIEKFK